MGGRKSGSIIRPEKDQYISFGRNRIARLQVYRVCLGPLDELSVPTIETAKTTEIAENCHDSELSVPTIPKGVIDNLKTLKSGKDGEESSLGNGAKPKLTTKKRYKLAQRESSRRQSAGVDKAYTAYEMHLAREIVKIIDGLDTTWRGGRETYLYELMVRHSKLFYERIQVREIKLLKGSRLTNWAVLKAANESRELLKERRSLLNPAAREQVNRIEQIVADLAEQCRV